MHPSMAIWAAYSMAYSPLAAFYVAPMVYLEMCRICMRNLSQVANRG